MRKTGGARKVSSTKADGMLWQKLKKGDYVFIQFGHNDEKQQSVERYTDPHGAYKSQSDTIRK